MQSVAASPETEGLIEMSGPRKLLRLPIIVTFFAITG